jgi:hypothetical protein
MDQMDKDDDPSRLTVAGGAGRGGAKTGNSRPEAVERHAARVCYHNATSCSSFCRGCRR